MANIKKSSLKEKYKNNYLPDFNSDYTELCMEILSQIDISELSFLQKNFLETRGNNFGWFFPEMHSNGYSCRDLRTLVDLFEDVSLQKRYDSSYNMVNYVVNSVYRHIDLHDGHLTKQELFQDLGVRNLLVQDNFTRVVNYLWKIREKVPDAKICIGNTGLTRNRNKTCKEITFSQKGLIDAVAFGCSYNELCHHNYEGAKKLIYTR